MQLKQGAMQLSTSYSWLGLPTVPVSPLPSRTWCIMCPRFTQNCPGI